MSLIVEKRVFASRTDDIGDTIAHANEVIVTAVVTQPVGQWMETDWRFFLTGLVAKMEDSMK